YLAVELVLPLRVVRLHLQVVAVAEHLRVPRRRLLRLLATSGHQVSRNLARHAGRRHDHALGILLQDLAVDPRPVVEALEVPDRGEPDDVPVADLVTGDQHQVVVLVLSGAAALHSAVARRDVRLHPQQRLEPVPVRKLLERPRAEHAAVVRESERRHLEIDGAPDEVLEPVRAVEQRVFAVGVQVYERHSAAAASVQDCAPEHAKESRIVWNWIMYSTLLRPGASSQASSRYVWFLSGQGIIRVMNTPASGNDVSALSQMPCTSTPPSGSVPVMSVSRVVVWGGRV